MPAPKSSTERFERDMLAKITELTVKIDQSLLQGQHNGEGIRNLRTELGIESAYGRLPQLESIAVKTERRLDNHEDRINAIERGEHEARGGKRVIVAIISLLGGGLGATLIALLGKAMGLIH